VEIYAILRLAARWG